MSKWDLKYHKKRRRSLDETNAGPILRLSAAVLLALCLAALLIFVAIPGGKRLVLGAPAEQRTEGVETPAPSPTPTPEITFTGKKTELGMAGIGNMPMLEPSIGDGRILFVSGADAENPDRLYAYDLASGKIRRLSAICENGQLRHPVEDGGYLLYEDVSPEGGGAIRVKDLQKDTDEVFVSLRYDAPNLCLDGGYLAYTARTGEDTAELYLAEVSSGQGIAAARFTGSEFGASEPYLSNDVLYYADFGADGSNAVIAADIASGKRTEHRYAGTPHDPKAGEGFVAFLSAPHGQDANLLVSVDGGAAVPLMGGVFDFAVSGEFLVYSREGILYAALPASGAMFQLTDGTAYCLLLAAGNGRVLYREGEIDQMLSLEYRINGEG